MNTGAPATTLTSAGVTVSLNGAGTSNNLNGFTVGASTTTAIAGTSFGTLNVGSVIINNTTGQALVLNTGTVSTPANYAGFTSTTSSAGTNNVSLTTIAGTVNLGSGALSVATGDSFLVSGGAASINYSGTITSGSAHSVNITGKTGGTVALSGAINDTDTGITLTANTAATVTFSGGISASTATNTAFNATGSGTVNVCDENPCNPAATGALVNTLTTTTATALNVQNVTIGANNLEFKSISSSGGTATGIILVSTGSTGVLVVKGDGGTTRGGNASGGTITNKTGGTDGDGTGASGVYINSGSATLRNMTLTRFDNFGIYGLSVNNVTVQYSTVGAIVGSACAGVNGDIGTSTGAPDAAIVFGKSNPSGLNGFNNAGTFLLDNLKVFCSIEHQVEIYQQSNTFSGTISNSDIKDNSTAGGSDGIQIEMQGTANSTISIDGNSFDDNKSQAAQGAANDSSILDLTVNNNTVIRSTQGNEGFVLSNGSNGHLTTHVTNNTMSGLGGAMIFVGQTPGNATTSSLLTAVIKGNTITHPTTATNHAIIAFLTSTVGQVAPANILIDTNNVTENSTGGVSRAIIVDTPDASTSPSFTATVTSNTVSVGDNVAGVVPIVVQARQSSAGCFDIRLNTATFPNGTPAGVVGIRARQVAPATANLEQGVSAGTAATVLAANNLASTTEVLGTITVVGNSTCLTAPTIAQPDDGNTPEQTQVSKSTLTNGGSSASPTMFARLRQAISPVAAFATKLNFLRKSEVPVIPALTSAEKSAAIAEVNGINATQKPDDQKVTPQSGETITVNGSGGGFTLPAGKSITITYDATVNSPPLVKSVSTQGHVTFTGGPGGGVPTDDPETGAANDATVTNINTTSTWVGGTSTDWNDATNWNPNTYAPGVSNPGVNDVVIPNVGFQPTTGTTDNAIFSLNISNGRTLTITSPRILTIGGAPGGNLTLDGIISGGFLNFGTGAHTIFNAGPTGSISSTNLTTVLSGSTVTLNNNLQMGSLQVNSGGTMIISNTTLSLNGPGAALVVQGGGVFTPAVNGDDASPGTPPGDGLQAVGSTVVYNGSVAQTGPGLAYFSLTINNPAGVTFTGNASINASGLLALTSGDLNMGTFTMSQPLSSTTSGGGDVVGNLTRTNGGVQFPSATNITFGNPNTLLNFTAAGTRPTSINFRLTETAPTDAATGGTNTGFPGAVKRTWLITPTGGAGFSATMQLHYLVGDLNGNVETNTGPGSLVSLRLYKYVINSPGTGWQQQDFANNFANTTIDTSSPSNHFVKLVGVTGFSPWTIGGVSPTAANSTVSGRITDDAGNPVEGAVIRLNGTQNRKTITDSQGNYAFSEVETNGFYTVTPSRVNYNFAPATRGFSALGAHTEASFGATSTGGHQTPIDTPEYFVRQQYVDFLGREPEEKGFNDWTDTINNCAPGDASCDRVHVSEMFFRSEEFQQRGYFVYRFYSTAFGQKPDYAAFGPDLGRVSGFLDATQLEAAKTQFANDFTNRAAFVNQYGQMSNAQYVDALAQTAGVTLSNRQALVNSLEAGTLTRAAALRQIAESGEVYARYYNQAFVVMEYFGYLRRDPDALYLNWISVLDANPADSRHMVEGFVDATEYRNRFKQ